MFSSRSAHVKEVIAEAFLVPQATSRTRRPASPSSLTSRAAPCLPLFPSAYVDVSLRLCCRRALSLTILARAQVRFLSGSAYTGTSAFPSLAAAAGDASFSLSAIAPLTKRDQLVAASLLASLRDGDDAEDGESAVDGWADAKREMEDKVAAVKELRERLLDERGRSRRRGAAVRVDV